MKCILFVLLLSGVLLDAVAQVATDTLHPGGDSSVHRIPVRQTATKPDSLAVAIRDTMIKKPAITGKQLADTIPKYRRKLYVSVLSQNTYFNFFRNPRYEIAVQHSDPGKDGLFYLLTGLVFYFSLVKLLFGKYVSNLFAVFFRVSLKQKQIREQLMQSPLPSLLLNIFFVLSGGIYVSFLLRYYNFMYSSNRWWLMAYSIIVLAIIYLVKFIVLKIMGWIFNISEATDTYIFVVFLVNKLLGVFLVPFLILLAFSSLQVNDILVTLSFTLVAIFFGYRYVISYAPVRKEVKVSQFHFVLYICALELIPLLLIYKVLLTFLEKSS